MNKKSLKTIVISAIIILIVFGACLLVSYLKRDKEYNHLRTYKANEYIPTHVTYETLAKIYLNDYMYYMRYDVESAYNLLDTKYRDAKFNSLEDFTSYINDIVNKKIKMKKYIKYSRGKFTIYKIYDENGYVFIFKTNGVMQYRVYLDENTVEVGE